ncbi:hypothetical protein BKA70DRAFT_1128177 [Coprinopsis sp. MPI-PUGE-AT-0042]|nr:hypothetical protein BKA70DRAFT_1128177 [Coprinopsis sp. MPI-PUGE-AT-0042]
MVLDDDNCEEQPREPVFASQQERQHKRPREEIPTEATAEYWRPWADRITCTLDILMHLPRSAFSEKQLDLFVWLLTVNNVDGVPTVRRMKESNKLLQRLCGIETLEYTGAFGNMYSVNSLSQLLSQELSNPLVREHLWFYPEDTGKRLEEARQGTRWLHEAPHEYMTPMVRVGAQDFYTFEPAMLDQDTFCIPFRWFIRDNQMYGNCWRMTREGDGPNLPPGEQGWRVWSDDTLVVAAQDLTMNFERLCSAHKTYHVPHPSLIIDIREQSNPLASNPWKYTNPVLGNKWRCKAQGRRVVSMPMWWYCDDTSGNVSKKWNKHNSFLFTLAGLPREEAQKEYNVHFLSTSNTAPPLEMLDGILDQLEESQENGIWAWDWKLREPVLLVPWVLALLGDNPMQSELSSHIGMRGKLFCRMCYVKGSDALDALSAAVSGKASAANDVPPAFEGLDPLTAAAKFVESMQQMADRVSAFMKIGKHRTKAESEATLRSYFTDASSKLHVKTAVKKHQTSTGIKDVYQEHWLQKLFASYRYKRGETNKEAALKDTVNSLPSQTTSPVWRIKGLDPHHDTPVEILHVVLLGFVKYFWRDVCQNRVKKDPQRRKLIDRLNSLDVRGLGISKIRGTTLVQYCGSLTGRDFRVVAQVAPFVLYDLVDEDLLAVWVSLSKIIPLIWTPSIDNIDEYTTILEREIEQFLLRTARVTNRWFSKPKFHVVLHLPSHIRRFGPAILFATENFESFNAIIRAKSVHSNRQAPSRDIAIQFAQANRVRHLMSGGMVLKYRELEGRSRIDGQAPSVPPRPTFSHRIGDWTSVGLGPRNILFGHCTPASYLGLNNDSPHGSIGEVEFSPRLAKKTRMMSETLTGQFYNDSTTRPACHLPPPEATIKTAISVVVSNRDRTLVGDHVLVRWASEPSPRICRIREILSPVHGLEVGCAIGILVQPLEISEDAEKYEMPRLALLEEMTCVRPMDILCSVNVQHNCAARNCASTGTRTVRQERKDTTATSAYVEHLREPNDLILNVAKMRDHQHLKAFYRPSSTLPFDETVLRSAQKEVDARKAAPKKSGKAKGKPKPAATLRKQATSGAAGQGLGGAKQAVGQQGRPKARMASSSKLSVDDG